MPKLRLGIIDEKNFRANSGVRLEDDPDWKYARKTALERDRYTCRYCGFSSEKYMEVHHIDGQWQDDSQQNLMTVCPLCHSCLHIGRSGLKNMGRLVVLNASCDQAALNKLILDTAVKYGSRAMLAIDEIYKSLPVKEDLSNAGLTMLAQRIAKKRAAKEPPFQVKDSYIFFPNPLEYEIIRWIASGDSRSNTALRTK